MRLDGHLGLLDVVEAAGNVADFRQVEVDIAVLVIGHKVVDGEDVEVFGEFLGLLDGYFEGLFVDAEGAAFERLGVVEYVAQGCGNTVF